MRHRPTRTTSQVGAHWPSRCGRVTPEAAVHRRSTHAKARGCADLRPCNLDLPLDLFTRYRFLPIRRDREVRQVTVTKVWTQLRFPFSIDKEPEHDCLQFTDVPRPSILLEHFLQSRCQSRRYCVSRERGLTLNTLGHQRCNVLAALPQRRYAHAEAAKSRMEIGKKLALLDEFLQRHVRRPDQADIDLVRALSADWPTLGTLDDAKQFSLNRQRCLAEFIEKEGTVVGEREVPDASLLGVGVGSTDVTEQLGAREGIVNAGEIGLSKWSAGSSRPAMNMLGEEGLSRPRLPFEENERLVHRREATKTPKHRAKCRTHRAQFVHPLPSTQALWRLVVRCGDGSQLEERYSEPSRPCHVEWRIAVRAFNRVCIRGLTVAAPCPSVGRMRYSPIRVAR